MQASVATLSPLDYSKQKTACKAKKMLLSVRYADKANLLFDDAEKGEN